MITIFEADCVGDLDCYRVYCTDDPDRSIAYVLMDCRNDAKNLLTDLSLFHGDSVLRVYKGDRELWTLFSSVHSNGTLVIW